MVMRKPKPVLDPAAAETAWREAAGARAATTKIYDCQTLTPLYGGGVKAGEVDTELPIRPSGLRGQLRFWWRLLNRDRFSSPRELFAAEKALWGGIGADGPTASRVRLRVGGVSKLETVAAFTFGKKPDGKYRGAPDPASGINAYALFSAQGALEKGSHAIKEHPSRPLAFEQIEQFIVQRLEELGQDLDAALREPDRTRRLARRGDRLELCDRLVASTDHDRLSRLDPGEILGEPGLRFVHIDGDHGPKPDYISDQLRA
jgi:RAMP superfamily protein